MTGLSDFKMNMLLLKWDYEESRNISHWTKGIRKISCVAGKHPMVLHLHLDWDAPERKPIVFHCFESLLSYIDNWE